MNAHPKPRRVAAPLNAVRLEELALRYVGRFSTTRAKLRSYLARKIRERGWGDERQPNLEALAERFARQGYVDDAAYAMMKSQALTGRGYGKRRVMDRLRAAGIGEEDGEAARDFADREAAAAALRFAERRKIGPFADAPLRDPKAREKAIAAMVRAGHPFALVRAILDSPHGQVPDLEGR